MDEAAGMDGERKSGEVRFSSPLPLHSVILGLVPRIQGSAAAIHGILIRSRSGQLDPRHKA